jgi:Domain of Unknown Function (DUF1206)
VTGIATSSRRVAEGQGASAAGRIGLAARGFVYLVIGWLAIKIARGHRAQEANQRGALADIARHSFGMALLWVLGFGFAAYALWRFSEAAFGTAADGKKTGARLKSLARGAIYAGLCVSTFLFIAGTHRQNQSKQQATLTARVLRHSFGQWLVGLAGVVVLIVGLGMIANGLRRKFEKNLKMHELHGTTRTVVVYAGMIGTIARGIVFAIAGALVIDAAVTFDPKKSKGLDGALRTLAGQPYGPWLLGLVAAGLIVFGLYGFALARWGKT